MRAKGLNLSGARPGPEITLKEPLWTVVDVANYLQLKQETVRTMARAHRLPAVKVGKVWRFRASEILKRFGENTHR